MTQLYKTCLECEHAQIFSKNTPNEYVACFQTDYNIFPTGIYSTLKDFADMSSFKLCPNVDKIKVLEDLEDL